MATFNDTDTTSPLPQLENPTSSLMRCLVMTILSFSIVVNISVFGACIKKEIYKMHFNLLLMNMLAANLIICIDSYVAIYVDIREYHQAPLGIRILMCIVTQRSMTKAAGGVLAITLVYISFLRASTFEQSNMYTQLILVKRKIVGFIAIVWILLLLVLTPLPFICMNTINEQSRICHSPDKSLNQSLEIGFICFSGLSWLAYITIFVINFLRASVYFCNHLHFEQSTLAQHKRRILTILVGQSLTFTLTTIPYALSAISVAITSIQYKTDIPSASLEMLHMVDLFNIPCLVALLQLLFDPLVIAYTVFGRSCRREIAVS